MCAGRPLVASRVGGLVEMLGEGERGVFVPPNDPDELASGISWMIESPDEAARFIEEDRRFATSLTVGRHVSQLVDVYEEIREERAAPAVR